jgi:transposase
MDQETGECGDRRLNHSDGEAERFYKELKERGVSVRVGLEALDIHAGSSGYWPHWVSRCGLAMPKIWVRSPDNRDVRQLLWHRHRLVQMRTRIMNQLQAVAMNEGYRWKKKLFREKGRALLEKLSLAPWASRRRKELLELLDQLDQRLRS